MRITDLLQKDAIQLDAAPADKEAAIQLLVKLHEKAGNIADRAQYHAGILAREKQGTTAVGDGIAIPHCKSEAVQKPGLAAITVPGGVDYHSMDGKPTNLIFMIAAPTDGDLHLEVLSRLTILLMDAGFRTNLLAAKSAQQFLAAIDAKEKEKFPEETGATDVPAVQIASQPSEHKILAVTACPTGIAHTFMAAEALEQKAKEMGCYLKAETNGSGGAKNVLTKKEIEQADGIIIAADKNVEMARFDGKRLISVKVSDGIHKPGELIQRILDGDAPVYHADGRIEEDSYAKEEKESAGHKIYKHLMNGVSHMLPFVVGGGILIALSFLLDDYSIDPANFGSNLPMAAWFNKLGNYAFSFMMPILAGFIARSIADRPGLAVGFVGGFIANLGMTFAQPKGAVSAGFLGALLAGFASGLIVLGLKKLTSKLPQSLEGIKPVLLYPLIGILLIGLFMCAVNPFVAMLNTGLTNLLNTMGSGSKIALGAVLGAMMSIDMGGPFNKAAYVFGTAAIASGGFDIMAAVMVGGMVPPISIALATTFFKSRFTKNERKSGVVNYILGLCFITEGAIPFAASDPLRVIPSCALGSAVAGGLSMAFHCGLRAPHGGLFVFPVVDNALWYIVALAAGSLVGMAMLAILKKPRYREELKQEKAVATK